MRYLILRGTWWYIHGAQRYTVHGTRKIISVQGSRPVSGKGAPPCVEAHIHFSTFSLLFFNLSLPAVLFVANCLFRLFTNVTG